MSEIADPYWKLRPPPATPAEDICRCAGSPPITLQGNLSSNPLACVVCNLEVPPQRIGFSEELAERIANWAAFHD